jgi:hypothetical protein
VFAGRIDKEIWPVSVDQVRNHRPRDAGVNQGHRMPSL